VRAVPGSGVVAGVPSTEVVAMPDREGLDVGVRGARRGIAVVVAATGGYLLVLWVFALLAAWVVRVT
jgi:hypothetical protein